MSKKTINPSQQKLLWGKSASRCAICKEILHKPDKEGKDYPIGEMAHIEGEKPDSARYNANMTDEERNNYQNRILLCPTHHTIIDKDENEYTVEKLRQVKKEHEKWIQDSLRTQIADITFAELDVILKYLMAVPVPIKDEAITVIPPGKKIKKNELSVGVGNLITMGMMQAKLVENYLNKHPDTQFADRLRAGFVKKYEELRKQMMNGDILFFELLDFASINSMEFKQITAGLSVLVYFFEKCDVFEE
jgi:hypothetical protein